MKKVLLLGASYEVHHFIEMKRAIKLLVNEKIEVISFWEESITFGNGKMKLHALVRLVKPPKRHFFGNNFSRKALVKRDRSTCQYCNRKLSASQVTMDHVIPRAQGGITSFVNCVVSCQACNNKKADRTPKEANMKLLRRPTLPSFASRKNYVDNPDYWHKSWDDFLNC